MIDSENCPYNEDEQTLCNRCACIEECPLNVTCDLSHYVKKQHARKRAVYGVIGVNSEVAKVYKRMHEIGYSAGIYTLMWNEFDDTKHIELNMEEILRELYLFQKLAIVDPKGDFTPVLLHSCMVMTGTNEFMELEKICSNMGLCERAIGGYHRNNDLKDMVASNKGGIFFLYVSDAGKTLYSYSRMVTETPLCMTLSTQDVIESTRNFAKNYQKLAAVHIRPSDLHSGNIAYKMTDGKMNLSIIDFECNKYYQKSVGINYMHLLFSGLDFTRRRSAEEHIRECDPVHYVMFVMAFEMLHICLCVHKSDNLRGLSNPLETNLISEIVSIMSDGLFKNLGECETNQVMADMLGYPAGEMYCESLNLQQQYQDFMKVVTDRYGSFYSMQQLKTIWWRVCRKLKECVLRYGHENTLFLQELSTSRTNGPVNQFTLDQEGFYTFDGMPAYLRIFDDFSMAFYDKERFAYDMDFLKKKSDEYSVGFYSVYLMKLVYFAGQKDPELEREITRIQNLFSGRNFLLESKVDEIYPPRELEKEDKYTMDSLSHTCAEVEIWYELMPVAESPKKMCTVS
jgi:hypothetical protein